MILFNHYFPKKTIAFIAVLILAISVPLTLFVVKHQQDIRQRATAIGLVGVIRGQPGDLWADTIIGKPDFGEITPNEVVPYKLFLTFGGGVIVDRSVSPGRLYVWDGGNSRILGIDLARCYGQNSPCSADIIIGQPSGTDKSACNGDGDFQNFTLDRTGQTGLYRAPASASTLCGIKEDQASITENISMANMYTDPQGNLYVPDVKNSRVLKYNNPFTTDTIADEVWGQTDFSGVNCNQDPQLDYAQIRNPTASTICFQYSGGVTSDKADNVWVADTSNNRVLRFPKGSKDADIILGQASATTRSSGSALNQMTSPSALRFGTDGKLYVVDSNRILVFNPNFATGMSASGTFGSNLCPVGLEVDPSGAGMWVQDECGGHSRVLLLDWNGNVSKILGKDTINNNNECAGTICNNMGSIGVDSLGNVLVSNGRYVNDVLKFSPPFPDPSPGNFYQPSKRLFSPPDGQNLKGAKGLGGSLGSVAVSPEQLIAVDGRILFWNNPQSITNGKSADGVINPGSPIQNFTSNAPWGLGGSVSDGQRFWILIGTVNEVWVYRLPLTNGANPIQRITFPLSVLGGGQLTGTDGLSSIEVQNDGKYLWVSQGGEYTNIHRVFRIRDPLTNPLVDVILGQANATDTGCNRDPHAVSNYGAAYARKAANTVCFPSVVKSDRLGNIWVSDYQLEFKGNWRLLEYNASLFNNITNQALFGPDANKIFPDTKATGIAFDSTNRMFVGNGLAGRFYSIFNNPLGPSTIPDRYLNDYYSVGASAVFDNYGNLYTSDLNRAKILKYLNPFNTIVPTNTPTATPIPTATPVPTSTPTPLPTSTPIPTATPTPVPIFTPTPVPTNTPTPVLTNTPTPVLPSPTPLPTNTPTPIPPTNTPASVIGDINGDHTVNIQDFEIWRCEFVGNGTCSSPPSNKSSDLDGNTIIDLRDYIIWRNAFTP